MASPGGKSQLFFLPPARHEAGDAGVVCVVFGAEAVVKLALCNPGRGRACRARTGDASATFSAVRGIESRRASAPWPRDDRSDSGRGAVDNKGLRLSFFTAVRTPLSMQRARHSCSGG